MSMYLVGSTPKGANASLLGEYKRTRRAKVYTFTSDPSRFLHYSRGRWWVGATPGEWSGYLYVKDDAATPDKITATWKVYDGEWLDAPNLRCVATSPLASAAAEVFIVGKTPGGVNSGSLGKFVRGADLLNSRYVYRKVTGGNVSYLFYAIGSWWVGDSLPRGSSAGGYVRMETDAWLPELAPAHGWLVASSQSGWLAAPDIRCVTSAPAPPDPRSDGKYIDASFPPEQSSLGSAAGWDAPTKVDCWLRAGALAGTDSDLFDGIGPGDLLQGSIGDCFLLASLACVAEHPELIESLFLEEQASDTGAYTLRLFSAEAGEWVSTTIDDTIPSSWNWGHPETLFAGSNATSPGASGEEWAMLLEKAVAKYCGSYGALVGGSSAWALQLLLGPSQPVQVFQRVDSRGLRWGAFRLERERLAASGAARSPGEVFLIGTPGDERGADEIWRGVLDALASRHVVTTGGVEKAISPPLSRHPTPNLTQPLTAAGPKPTPSPDRCPPGGRAADARGAAARRARH